MRFPWTLNSALAVAPFLAPREVPQEHSHSKWVVIVHEMLYLNNTLNIKDPVFGLLDNTGAANCDCTDDVQDMSCLQLVTADVAFTNAKQRNDVEGMVASLIYRTLERNTNAVGERSPLCTTYQPRNPELRSLTQHQDPASTGAEQHNRGVVLELARQINAVGGDPLLALEAGTFAPGRRDDPTAAGLSCNSNDCIYQNNRLVELVSEEEIELYVDNCVPTVTITVTETLPASTVTERDSDPTVEGSSGTQDIPITTAPGLSLTRPADPTSTSSSRQSTATQTSPPSSGGTDSNLQTFGGNLGGISAPTVTRSGSGSTFLVQTVDAPFNTLRDALTRSCDVQNNLCSDEANASRRFTVTQCGEQATECRNLVNQSS